MRLSAVILAVLIAGSAAGCLSAHPADGDDASRVVAQKGPQSWPPIELDVQVPFEPTAFPSLGQTYLIYELHLTNFAAQPVTFQRVEVLDAANGALVAALEGGELDTLLHRVGDPVLGEVIPKAGGGYGRQIEPGRSTVVFLRLKFDDGVRVPPRLLHRIVTGESSVEGAVVGMHHTDLRVLGPPVGGAHWLASGGPSNDSHHRRGLIAWGGRATISRRYAIDWLQIENGESFVGDRQDNHSYFAYGEPVLAVADGRVVAVQDSVPENAPHRSPAAPLTYETSSGNMITLDIGGGQFAHYDHLKGGSMRVKLGQHVRRGDVLAEIGVSGDSREAHLHFEVTDAPGPLLGEGVPYVIDQYDIEKADGGLDRRRRELPLRDLQVAFQ